LSTGQTPTNARGAQSLAAVVILIATVVAEKRAVRIAVALGGGLGIGLALVAVLVSDWGSTPRIPASAQVVRVAITASDVRLEPA